MPSPVEDTATLSEEGMSDSKSPSGLLVGQILLGTETFVQQAGGLLGEKDEIAEIPRIQRHVGRPHLDNFSLPTLLSQKRKETG